MKDPFPGPHPSQARGRAHAALRGRAGVRCAALSDGDPVVVVPDDSGGSLVVAGEGEPYPLEVVGSEDEGTLTLGEFGEEQDITAPEDPLDLADIGG